MREYLKSLGLDPKVINSIMVEVGKKETSRRKEMLELQKYKKESEATIKQLNAKIEESNKSLENLQNLTNENKDLHAQLQMSNSNVKKEFSKFVTNEVMSSVNDDTDFETALNNYKKENPQYFGDTVVKKVQSSPNLTGGVKETTTNDIMNDILRGAKE